MQLIRSVPGTVRPGTASWAAPTLVVLLALAVGWASVSRPALAFAVVASPLAAVLLVSPTVRVLVMVIGPIAVFGGSQELTPPKLMFLAAAAAAFAGSFLRSRSLQQSTEYRLLKPMFYASAAVLALAVVSLGASYIDHVPLKPWIRGISPYLLFAAAPYFALDACTAIPARRIRALLVAAGIFGAVAFAVTWLHNRGIATLPVTWFGFATVLLPAALFSYSIAAALQGNRHSPRWLALAAVIFGLLASTGTRSALVLLGAPLAIVVATRREFGRRLRRLVFALPLAAVLVAALFALLIARGNVNTTVLLDRQKTLLSSGSHTDRSYLDRLSQGRAAYAAFRSSELVGVGPGVEIEWRNSFGVLKSTPTVDSPLGYLAKFGLLGLGVLAVLVGSYVSFFRRVRAPAAELASRLALVGFGAIVVLWSTLNVPFEDKGFPVAMMLLLALAVAELREAP